MFFAFFWIFLKIYQNMGQKLGSNNNNHFYSYVYLDQSGLTLVQRIRQACSIFFSETKISPLEQPWIR